MARKLLSHGGRRSGWPPEQSGHSGSRPMAIDDIALVVLWIVVLAGLVFVGIVVLSTLFGWDIRLASTAEAAQVSAAATEVDAAPTDSADTSLASTDAGAGAVGNSGAALGFTPSISPEQKASVGGSLSDVSADVGVALGKVLEAEIHSNILNRNLPYRVYLPPGYDSSDQRYPVIYLLHGNGLGLYTEWTSDNRIGVVADALIAAGKVQPMIIMMPDGEHSYFMNEYGTGERWEDYILDEVIPFTDVYFRTIPDKAHRAIGGHSMGGTGALTMAFTHPELFAAVGAHSPALHWTSEGAMPYFGPNDYYSQYNPLEIAKTAPNLDTLQIWVDFGDQDPWLPAGQILDPTLTSRGIVHEWHIFAGNHYTTYWIEHSPDYLEYYSAAFGPPPLI